jgi:undecaprenyl-diphosphatase
VDYVVLREINGLSGWSPADAVFRALVAGLPFVIAAIVAAAFLSPSRWRWETRRAGAVFATASAGVALLVAQWLADLVGRLHPAAAHPGKVHLLVTPAHDPSFPSDVATGAFALAMGMWSFDRRIARVLFALAGVLAFSRVYVGVEYPGDVLGGAVIGAGMALALSRSPLRSPIVRAGAMFSDIWETARAGAVRVERRYPASVLLTGSGIALLAASELADRIEHGLGAVMTFVVVDSVLWLLALGWIAARRLRPWAQDSFLVGLVRDWIGPGLAMAGATLLLLFVYTDHLSTAAGPDAWTASAGAALILIAQVIGQASPHNRS